MKRYEEQDDEIIPWDANTMRTTAASTDLFSEGGISISNPTLPGFSAAATSSVGRAIPPRRGSAGMEEVDLNSQALDLDAVGMTFGQLLRSSIGEADTAHLRRGVDPSQSVGAGLAFAGARNKQLGASVGTEPYPPPLPAATATRATTRPPGGRRGVCGGRGDELAGPIGSHHGVRGGSDDETAGNDQDDVALAEDFSKEKLFDKAEWNRHNNAVFCELCVEEIRAGNAPNGHMNSRGYKNLSDKFYRRVGLRHSKIQLKNRWDALKGMYTFWLWLNKQSGLGRTANGGVVASDQFWKDHTKGHAEWRKLRDGPPDCLADLEVMFQHIAVDGSSSCVPGELIGNGGDKGDVGEREDDGTPKRTTTLKRGCSPNTSVGSPKKRIKSPMVKIMKGIWETMQANSAVAQKVMLGELRAESIKRAMDLAVESGAVVGSPEHFMACKLFTKAENRDIFFTIPTSEGRLNFLKWWCKENNMY